MNIEMARNALLWCAAINYALLMVWFLLFTMAHDRMHRFHSKWFHLPVEQFDAIHYTCMAVYKLGIILFNLVPFIALYIVG